MSAAVYVYYRVDLQRAQHAQRTIEMLIDEVCDAATVTGRLLRRADDPSTWLEIYEPVHDFKRLVAALQAAADRHDIQQFLQAGSSRVTEHFVPIA